MADKREESGAQRDVVTIAGPWFEEFTRGDCFTDAPAVTLTDGYCALSQAICGDRLRLPLDAALAQRVTGSAAPVVNPTLLCNLAIGQSTHASQRVMGNLFYRGLILKRPVFVGETISTTTKVVALRQNRARPGRAASGMVVLEMTVTNQEGGEVMRFWRCPMIPCRDPQALTGLEDSLDPFPEDLAREDLVAAVPDWDLDLFAAALTGDHFAALEPGRQFAVESRDTVTSAPELARLTLNLAMTHRDEAQSVYGRRLVYGGHTIAIAAAQLSRALPNMVTILGWRRCDHVAPVFELDILRSVVTLGEKYPLAGRGGLVDVGVEVFATRGREAPEQEAEVKVLDWQLVALFA